ncbi:tyrosine-type recombinase/integrase [Thermomonospora sp. CIF 1]|uniref:tyrosine-type recombinase/integrase n=1 Tax=Thermomonospora sp. CIF 1 TaxID=1916083 RepID=UPI000B2BBB0C|nr:tyrosine-type recombinase/integrase [Thermomonospora sp. CIF 1]
MTPQELRSLLDSWEVHLKAEHKSPNTIKAYCGGLRAFLRWAESTGTPPEVDRPTVQAFLADLLDAGAEAATAHGRYRALRRFSAWLVEEGETDTDRLAGLKPPKLDQKVVPELTLDQVQALIKTCSGKTLRDRRDEAIIRFALETMARAGEVIAMEVDDVDVKAGTAVIRRGKGGKGRRVAFGPQTSRAIDRYLRARRSHPLANTPALWLGDRGRGFSYDGLYAALKRRARAAGLDGVYPHVLRHTGAGRWLAAGGSENGLMAIAGWRTRDMIDRYTRATSEKRAAEEAHRLNLGDF